MNHGNPYAEAVLLFVGCLYTVAFIGIIIYYLFNGKTRALNRPLRKQALDALEGNWGTAAVVTVVYFVISIICGYGFQWTGIAIAGDNVGVSLGGSLLSALIILPIGYAFIISFLGVKRGVVPSVKGLFSQYNKRVYLTMLLKGIYLSLWALLFIIPCIVKSYSYAMTEFIMKDNPELSGNAAIEASMAMMKGNKKRLFLLDLSFTGWGILCILTLGLGFILLYPYMYTARAAFYEELKGEQNQTSGNEAEYVKEY